MVAAHEGGEACVCELTEPLGLTQPTISHHLKVLVDAGIFTRDKRGVWAYYALVPSVMDALSAVLITDYFAGGRGAPKARWDLSAAAPSRWNRSRHVRARGWRSS